MGLLIRGTRHSLRILSKVGVGLRLPPSLERVSHRMPLTSICRSAPVQGRARRSGSIRSTVAPASPDCGRQRGCKCAGDEGGRAPASCATGTRTAGWDAGVAMRQRCRRLRSARRGFRAIPVSAGLGWRARVPELSPGFRGRAGVRRLSASCRHARSSLLAPNMSATRCTARPSTISRRAQPTPSKSGSTRWQGTRAVRTPRRGRATVARPASQRSPGSSRRTLRYTGRAR
jgi:hypothetical protein